MTKFLIIMSMLLSLISCEDIVADNSYRNQNSICGEALSACLSDLDWEIITNYDDQSFPRKVSMKIMGEVLLNECSTSNFPFTVNRGNVVLIEAQDYLRTNRSTLEIEIRDCSNNTQIFYSKSQSFYSNGRKLTINLK